MSPIRGNFAKLPQELQNYIIELAFIVPLKQRPCELLDSVPYSQREVRWSNQSRLFPPLTSTSNYIRTYAHNYNILRFVSGMGGLSYAC